MAVFGFNYNTILAKSAYVVIPTAGDPFKTLDYTITDLYIYQGDIVSDKPVSPTISIRKDAISGNDNTPLEISSIIESYFGSASGYLEDKNQLQVWWVEIDATIYYTDATTESYVLNGTRFALNGYYYSNDDFDAISPNILQSNSTIYVLNDNIVKVPMSFYYDGGTTTENVIVEYFENGNLVSSTTYTYNEDTADWLFIASPYSFDNFRDRVLSDGGIIEDNICNDRFFDRYQWGEIDTIKVTGNDATDPTTTNTYTLNVEYLEECRNDVYKVTFRNRFGVPQEIYMRGKYMESTNFKNDVLKRSTRSSLGSFNKQDFSYKKFNSNGRKQITLNTGFVKENQNEVFRQFLLSDSVWLTNLEDNSTIPVVVKNQSLEYKTSLNDKLINYTIEFEYAHDDIEVYF